MKRIIVTVLGFTLLLSACDNKRFYEEYSSIDNQVWSNKTPVSFKVNITDTISRYNLFAGIRNTELYKYMNLYVFMTVTAPNGKQQKDTVEFILANMQGKWLGNRAGDILDNRIWFKKDYKLDVAGDYTFEFEQAMREDNLPEITDFGLRLEKN